MTLEQCVPTARNGGLYKKMKIKSHWLIYHFCDCSKETHLCCLRSSFFANFRCYDPYKSTEWQL